MQPPTLEYSTIVAEHTLLCPSFVSVDSAPTFITGQSFLGGSYTIVKDGSWYLIVGSW